VRRAPRGAAGRTSGRTPRSLSLMEATWPGSAPAVGHDPVTGGASVGGRAPSRHRARPEAGAGPRPPSRSPHRAVFDRAPRCRPPAEIAMPCWAAGPPVEQAGCRTARRMSMVTPAAAAVKSGSRRGRQWPAGPAQLLRRGGQDRDQSGPTSRPLRWDRRDQAWPHARMERSPDHLLLETRGHTATSASTPSPYRGQKPAEVTITDHPARTALSRSYSRLDELPRMATPNGPPSRRVHPAASQVPPRPAHPGPTTPARQLTEWD
jgi:hypothetical protein